MSIKPIFVFCVSRSGSTLLQRIIAAHEGVATVSEPWLLLPYAYTRRRVGVDAEYQHSLMVDAIENFCNELPRGASDYELGLRDFVLRLYREAAGPSAEYFVDKSPPYCLISEDIIRLFPEGKFIFLWRNPLSVISSVIRTWDAERWHPTLYSNDLFIGLPRLLATYGANRERSYAIRYEDMVGGDEDSLRGLMDYIGIDWDASALDSFSEVTLNGPMGDPTGVKQYSRLSSEPQQKWKETLAAPLRREWSRRYLRYLGRDRLAVMGYDMDAMVRELDEQPLDMSSLLPDIWQLAKDVAKEPIRVRTRRKKIGEPNVIRELLRA